VGREKRAKFKTTAGTVKSGARGLLGREFEEGRVGGGRKIVLEAPLVVLRMGKPAAIP